MRENLGPTKYPRENILDLRNTHEKKFWTNVIPTKARWHDGTMALDPGDPGWHPTYEI